jgi:predicted NAD/FAD-dependent oxidoreductase
MSFAPNTDCVVVGASFAGLACAHALASAGMQVTVLEKKASSGEKLHTTGIIVKDAIDQGHCWTQCVKSDSCSEHPSYDQDRLCPN